MKCISRYIGHSSSCFCGNGRRFPFPLSLERQLHWQEDIFLTFPLALKRTSIKTAYWYPGCFMKNVEGLIVSMIMQLTNLLIYLRWLCIDNTNIQFGFGNVKSFLNVISHKPNILNFQFQSTQIISPCNWGVTFVCLRVIPLFLIVLRKWRQGVTLILWSRVSKILFSTTTISVSPRMCNESII